ncbi:methyltransferase family protein [Gelidibacter sediminis]|uniref:Methyltransferase family protein n=1 Tax=Gelidibacter sediminis TaxID=1608710 RepID=A0A4R7Q1P2_9FLAO|nr:class I SAM-dependent methyltransferase [Gelidibacter sediminis]TDU40421.1 methyltransferase family protein [Gelidibacter sediminis]
MTRYSDKKIIDSWLQNAEPWISAVQNDEIESRLLITNKAILNTILKRNPANVLDIGCGEGWLARALTNENIEVYGIDIVPELIAAAKKDGHGKFVVLPYEDVSPSTITEKFDVAVCNFSLLGKDSVANIFKNIPDLLHEHGAFIVQTLHPISGCGNAPYTDGWREGSWKGFNNRFSNPPPWYFRTLETWKDLFLSNGFAIDDIIEPLHPKTKTVASVIFVGTINPLTTGRN